MGADAAGSVGCRGVQVEKRVEFVEFVEFVGVPLWVLALVPRASSRRSRFLEGTTKYAGRAVSGRGGKDDGKKKKN